MEIADIPTKFPVAWAADATTGNIRTVPTDPPVQDGAASLQLGFPPVTLISTGAGGIPPFGQDTNGILNQITAWNQWQQAGGPIGYDSGFSSSIGGYAKGAILSAATLGNFWLSLTDDNTSDPDTGGANWSGFRLSGLYASDTGATNAYVATFIPPLAAYKIGQPMYVKIANANTGASTFNGGPGAVSIKSPTGADPVAGALIVGMIAIFIYDGTVIQCANLGATFGTAASKAASDNSQSTLASISGTPVNNNFVKWVVGGGGSVISVTDGGTPGQAAFKNVTGNANSQVVSLNSFTPFNLYASNGVGDAIDSGLTVTQVSNTVATVSTLQSAAFQPTSTWPTIASGGQFASGAELRYTFPLTVIHTDTIGFLGFPQNVQNGSYQFATRDSGCSIICNSGSSANWTIPSNATLPLPIGPVFALISTGGNVAITPAGGVTLYLGDGSGTTGARTLIGKAMGGITKTDTDTWITGGLLV